MKTCTFYTLQKDGPDRVRGTITLDNGAFDVSPQDDFMEEVLLTPAIVGGKTLYSFLTPEEWMDALPLAYTGTYLYCELQSSATKFNQNHDVLGRFATHPAERSTIVPNAGKKVPNPEFIGSPNTGQLNLEQAIQQLHSDEVTKYLDAAKEISRELHFEEAKHDVGLGLYEGGAEPTVVETAKGRVEADAIRTAAALMGKISGDLSFKKPEQNAMMVWIKGNKGPHTMYEVEVPHVTLPDVQARLQKAGVQFSTAIPHGDGVKVMMVHTDPADEEVNRVAKEIGGGEVKSTHGNVEFIEKADYDKIINDYAAKHPLHKAAFDRVHHHELEWPYPQKVSDILRNVVL